MIIQSKFHSRFFVLLLCIAGFASGGAAEKRADPPVASTRLIFDTLMRDPSVCRGGDGAYYLTGTTGKDVWVKNDGIEIWRSTDLEKWQPLGMVWSIEKNGTWQKQWTKKIFKGKEVDRRVVWAPEIHYIKKNYWLCYSMPGLGIGVLRSTTGKPEGPYVAVAKEPLVPGFIDASLFEDEDGKVYLLFGAGYIAPMTADLSALAEKPRQVHVSPADLDPSHHSKTNCKESGYDHIGFEGPFLFKAAGRYYFSCAENYNGRYSCAIASSNQIFGPYGARQEAIPKGGHSTFFQDDKGQWWSACFSTTRSERPALLRIELGADGTVKPLAPPAVTVSK